jgi:hypothetical protein
MPAEVVEARQWRHRSGRTASVYGSTPWLSESDRSSWDLEVVGYTVKHPDGTVGLGRPPFASKDEAQAWIDANPHFRGMRQD